MEISNSVDEDTRRPELYSIKWLEFFFKGDRTPKSNPSLSRTIEILTIELGGSQDNSKKESLLPYIATIVLIQDFVASYSRNDICHNAALMVVKLVYDLTDL